MALGIAHASGARCKRASGPSTTSLILWIWWTAQHHARLEELLVVAACFSGECPMAKHDPSFAASGQRGTSALQGWSGGHVIIPSTFWLTSRGAHHGRKVRAGWISMHVTVDGKSMPEH